MEKSYTEHSHNQFGDTRSGKAYRIDEKPPRKTKRQKKNTSDTASDTALSAETEDTTTQKDKPIDATAHQKPTPKKKPKT